MKKIICFHLEKHNSSLPKYSNLRTLLTSFMKAYVTIYELMQKIENEQLRKAISMSLVYWRYSLTCLSDFQMKQGATYWEMMKGETRTLTGANPIKED